MSIQITTELVKELRDATGISVMQCRNALTEAEGDINKALAILKKNSGSIAEKRGEREVKDGAVKIKHVGNKAVLLALLCETDFVSKNEDFNNLLDKLLEESFSYGSEKMKESSKEMIAGVVQKTGENIQLGTIYEMIGNQIGSYVHNNKIGVLVNLEGGNVDLAKDIAMHIAAMKPEYIDSQDIRKEDKKIMMEIFEKEIMSIDKPEEIKRKMLDGKISTYFKEKTLVDQFFIKDDNITVGKLLENNKAIVKEVKKYII